MDNSRFKFKVWNNVNKEWLKYKKWHIGWQYPLDKPATAVKAYMYVSANNKEYNELQFCIDSPNFNVVEFTGLQDCKGKDIFEGAIIRFDPFYSGDHREPGGTAEVKYVDDGYGLYISNDDYVCCVWDAVKNFNAEVVGNIYE